MILDIFRYLWRRDSESAARLCIAFSDDLRCRELRELVDYFRAVIEVRAIDKPDLYRCIKATSRGRQCWRNDGHDGPCAVTWGVRPDDIDK